MVASKIPASMANDLLLLLHIQFQTSRLNLFGDRLNLFWSTVQGQVHTLECQFLDIGFLGTKNHVVERLISKRIRGNAKIKPHLGMG